MKLVLAETITPAPVSATSKKITSKPGVAVAKSTYKSGAGVQSLDETMEGFEAPPPEPPAEPQAA